VKHKLVFIPFSNPDSGEPIRAIEKVETLQCSYDFLFLSYSQVKLNRDSDFDCS